MIYQDGNAWIEREQNLQFSYIKIVPKEKDKLVMDPIDLTMTLDKLDMMIWRRYQF